VPTGSQPASDEPTIDILLPGPDEPLWVFGYGSLMWDPGFAFAERRPAVLHGWHRRFCVISHNYRGTRERPGLVLGLDRGGSCRGVAFRVAPEEQARALDYLWVREMRDDVYRPHRVQVRFPGGRAMASTFVARRNHPLFFADGDPARVAALIGSATGERGRNLDYLLNTLAHLESLGIHDRHMEAIAAEIVGANLSPSA
jgi:cation transport protein ChaC